MTVRVPQLVWGGVVLLIVLGLMRGCGGAERQVRRALEDMGDLIAREPGETQLAAADKARRLPEHFTSDFQVRLEPFGTTLGDARELGRAFFAYRAAYESIEVAWKDLQIVVEAGGRRAEVATVATLSGRSSSGPARESYRLTFILRREDGSWRILEAVLIEVVDGLEGFL